MTKLWSLYCFFNIGWTQPKFLKSKNFISESWVDDKSLFIEYDDTVRMHLGSAQSVIPSQSYMHFKFWSKIDFSKKGGSFFQINFLKIVLVPSDRARDADLEFHIFRKFGPTLD